LLHQQLHTPHPRDVRVMVVVMAQVQHETDNLREQRDDVNPARLQKIRWRSSKFLMALAWPRKTAE
jgi:hypothetical protein